MLLYSGISVYVFVVLQLVGADGSSIEVKMGRTVCEHESVDLSCPDGEVVDIIDARYGRGDNDTCLKGPVRTLQCFAQNSLPVVQAHCQEKQACTVKASNKIFGDPCRNTYKYLTIIYACKQGSEKTSRVCEGETLKMECKADEGLDIRAAKYGRSSVEFCDHGLIHSHNCSSHRTLPIVQAMCQNESVCSVKADNILFGDPCPNTVKYLEVEYACSKIKVSGDYKRGVACEWDSLSLDCSSGNKSRRIAVKEANYGRRDCQTCFMGPIRTTSCITHNALQIVKDKCEGKKMCEVGARNSVFGDPCVQTFKYLEVLYDCVEEKELPTGEEEEKTISTDTKHPGSLADSNVVGCEGEAVTLECGIGDTVHVTSAHYGVSKLGVCPHEGTSVDTNCSSHIALETVRKICENSTACSIDVNTEVFGDPCPEINEYLNVTFQCVPSFTADWRNSTVCEGDGLVLKCDEEKVLKITWANYGRLDRELCPDGPIITSSCHNQVNTLSVARDRCEGRNECVLTAENDEFGDPCFGTYKYLTVSYQCTDKVPT